MDKLISILEQNKVQYEILRHAHTIRTAQEWADYFGIEIGQTAPILLLKSENGYFSLIKAGDRGRVDLQQIGTVLRCGHLQMATPKEVLQITGYSIGTVPLAGLSFPCILDKWLFRYPFVYGGTGESETTLKIATEDLAKVNQVITTWE